MKKSILSIAAVFYFFAISSEISAGTGLGGGGARQLQDIALSETALPASRLAEILDGSPKLNMENHVPGIRSVKLMESSSETHSGVLIEVKPTDFNLVVSDASEGREFVYRDATVGATFIDPEFRTVIMSLLEVPSVTIIVKDGE
jgi:hypothetical protein